MKPTAEFLQKEGYDVYLAREPGGTIIGDQVREILMNMGNTSMLPRAETLLFCAARAQLVEEIIQPHLEMGEIVLLDRYADSTLAYQGYGHENDIGLIKKVLAFATGGCLTWSRKLGCSAGKKEEESGIAWTHINCSTTSASAKDI
jgi:dTMP kinase